MVTVVPTSAITSFGGSEYVFVQVHGHEEHPHQHSEKEAKVTQQELGDLFSFQRIAVKKGITSDGYTEIIPLENLPEHTKVVINGSYYLNAMLTNTSGEHEH
jgi:hypothetical protein